jgi:hypothetical protein
VLRPDQPLPTPERAVDLLVWDVYLPAGRWLLYGLFAVGWLMVPAVTLMIHHFDLFGTRQVWLYLRGREYTSLPFRTPMLYGRLRSGAPTVNVIGGAREADDNLGVTHWFISITYSGGLAKASVIVAANRRGKTE